MQFQIRRAAQGDAGVLAFIQTESWKAAFQNILAAGDLDRLTSLDRAAAMYSRLLDENRGNGYIGELDGKPHSIAYWDKARDAEMAQYAEIICIHSLPAHWRMGFGSLMMDRLLADISKAGFHSVMLWVFTENVRARKFYEAKGFSVLPGAAHPQARAPRAAGGEAYLKMGKFYLFCKCFLYKKQKV